MGESSRDRTDSSWRAEGQVRACLGSSKHGSCWICWGGAQVGLHCAEMLPLDFMKVGGASSRSGGWGGGG